MTPAPKPSAVQSGNQLTREVIGGRPLVIKVFRAKPHNFKFYKYRVLALCGLAIPVEYRSPRQRRDFEREVYRRWRECGYAVPEVLDEVDLGNRLLPGTVALALEDVDGPTLDARLRDSTQGLPAQLELLERLFSENLARHECCLKEHDYRLVHF